MPQINYSHLHYFWIVAREGSIAKASEVLHLTPQTISGQIKLLEESIGDRLFNRVGRQLVPTDLGRVVYQYADEIFTIGAELTKVLRGGEVQGPLVFNVGIVNSLPKLIAQRILAPVLKADDPVCIRCQEASLDHLLGELAVHHLDLVLSDQAIPAGLSLRAYNHRLGESGLSFFVRKGDARRYRKAFPSCLNEAPMLLPSQDTMLRRRLDDWILSNDLSPTILGEYYYSAIINSYG